jgi:hypothetical protein
VKTTVIYAHALMLNRGGFGVRSPVDELAMASFWL